MTKISQLPNTADYPLRALAELRAKEYGKPLDRVLNFFDWMESLEGLDFWDDVNSGQHPPISAESIEDLRKAGMMPEPESDKKVEVFEEKQRLAHEHQPMKRYPLLPEKYLLDGSVRKALTEAIDNPEAAIAVFRSNTTGERTSFIVRRFGEQHLIVKFGTEAEIAEVRDRGVYNCDEIGETYEVIYETTTLNAMVREFNRGTIQQLLADLEELKKPKTETMSTFTQIQSYLKDGGYATRQCWAGNRKIYYFSPVAHGVETVSPDGQSMPMAPFYVLRVGDGPLTPYFPSDEDFNATDWQIFRKTYVQHF